jgi:hypothetical protein
VKDFLERGFFGCSVKYHSATPEYSTRPFAHVPTITSVQDWNSDSTNVGRAYK